MKHIGDLVFARKLLRMGISLAGVALVLVLAACSSSGSSGGNASPCHLRTESTRSLGSARSECQGRPMEGCPVDREASSSVTLSCFQSLTGTKFECFGVMLWAKLARLVASRNPSWKQPPMGS